MTKLIQISRSIIKPVKIRPFSVACYTFYGQCTYNGPHANEARHSHKIERSRVTSNLEAGNTLLIVTCICDICSNYLTSASCNAEKQSETYI